MAAFPASTPLVFDHFLVSGSARRLAALVHPRVLSFPFVPRLKEFVDRRLLASFR